MSQPIWTSLDPLTITADGVLDLGHGNWKQNDLTPLIGLDGKQPAPKWLPFVQIDGQRVYGDIPAMPSVPPSITFRDEQPWSTRLPFDLLPWQDGKPHTLTVDIFAAQYFTGWGDHPTDDWEWGYFNAKGEPAHLERSFTLIVGPPPPAPPNVTAAQTWLVEALNSLTRAVKSLEGSYAWSHPTAASYAATHAADVAVVDSVNQIEKAQAFLRGESP